MMISRPAPSVSICIPTYRGTAHLGAAIDSVLAQTYHDFELLIIDDNSPDETPLLVARYADPRIRYLRNPSNLGPEGNWNRCLAEARGKYFKLLPHDDLLTPACLERQVSVLEEDASERLAFVFCARRIIDARGRWIGTRGFPRHDGGVIPAGKIIRSCARYGTNLIGEPGGVLFRHKLAHDTGLFDASQPYLIDLDYWFRLLRKGDAHYSSEPLAEFRVSAQSWSVAIGKRQSVDFCDFIDRINRTPQYPVNRFDILAGHFMARINKYSRLMFYRFVLKRV